MPIRGQVDPNITVLDYSNNIGFTVDVNTLNSYFMEVRFTGGTDQSIQASQDSALETNGYWHVASSFPIHTLSLFKSYSHGDGGDS